MKNKEELQSIHENFAESVKKSNEGWQKTYELINKLKAENEEIKLKLIECERKILSKKEQASVMGAYGGLYSSNNHNNQCAQTSSCINEKADQDQQEFKRPTNPQ